MPTAQALRRAQELGLDLVLVSPTAVPPVAKAIDYGHYQYELKKKQHDARKKQHVVQVKELKFRPEHQTTTTTTSRKTTPSAS